MDSFASNNVDNTVDPAALFLSFPPSSSSVASNDTWGQSSNSSSGTSYDFPDLLDLSNLPDLSALPALPETTWDMGDPLGDIMADGLEGDNPSATPAPAPAPTPVGNTLGQPQMYYPQQGIMVPGNTFPATPAQFLPQDVAQTYTSAYTGVNAYTATQYMQPLEPQNDNVLLAPPPPPSAQPMGQGPAATTQAQQQQADNAANAGRPYCALCNYTAPDPSGLATHRKSAQHQQAAGLEVRRPWLCHFCTAATGHEKAFLRSDALKRHLRNSCPHRTWPAGSLPEGYRDGPGGMDAGRVY